MELALKEGIRLILTILLVSIPQIFLCYYLASNPYLFTFSLILISTSVGYVYWRFCKKHMKNDVLAAMMGALTYSFIFSMMCIDIALYKDQTLSDIQIPIYCFGGSLICIMFFMALKAQPKGT